MISQETLRAALVERHGEKIQCLLEKSSVGVAGLGGLGSHIAVQLTRLGVGRLVLADFDRVELSNLHRQHYQLKHIGQRKTEALVEQLKEINPFLSYEIHTERIVADRAAELFSSCQVLCEAFDRADEKAMLIENLMLKKPTLAIVSGSGLAGYASGNEIKVKRKFKNLYLCGDEHSKVADGLALMAPRVTLCASQQALAALRILLGLEP